MAHCVTCGAELHPERALKYDYRMVPACQEKNANRGKGCSADIVAR
jgi:hypothetical protein